MRASWAFVVVLIVLVVLAPLVEALGTPPGHEYSWALFQVPDFWAYQMVMRTGWDGGWLYEDRFTHEAHPDLPIFTLYLGLGHLARIVGVSLPVMFHLARSAGTIAALLVTLAYVRREIPGDGLRAQALILALFASGLGWLFVEEGSHWLWIEHLAAPHLATAVQYPHYLLEYTALAGSLLVFERHAREGAHWRVAIGMAAVLVIAAIHPFMVAPAVAIPATWAAINGWWPWLPGARGAAGRRATAWVLAVGLTAVPLVAWYFQIFFLDPEVAAWRSEAISLPLSPVILVLLYGVVSLAAYVGMARIARDAWSRRAGDDLEPAPGTLSLAWALPVIVLVSSRMISNWLEFALFASVPAGVLAIHGLRPWLEGEALIPRISARLVVVAGAFTGLLRLALSVLWLPMGSHAKIEASYWPTSYVDGIRWLAEQPRAVVLAPDQLALQLPALTDLVPYAGHFPSTIHYDEKDKQRDAFLAGTMTPAEAEALVRSVGISLVLEDRFVDGAPVDVSGYAFLEPHFENESLRVWRVREP